MHLASVAALLLLAGAVQAQGIDRGRLLYDTYCGTCHTERLHDREKSLIRSYGSLKDEVYRRADLVTNRRFSADELEDIIEFLDRSHYRLDVPRIKGK